MSPQSADQQLTRYGVIEVTAAGISGSRCEFGPKADGEFVLYAAVVPILKEARDWIASDVDMFGSDKESLDLIRRLDALGVL